MENFFEKLMYSSRWIMAPIYLGLSLALLALGIKFFQEVIHIIPIIFSMKEVELILVVLSLIDIALVGGAGPIGLLLSAILKAKGLKVIITELSAKRKEKAKESGVADYILDPSEVDVVSEVMKINNGDGVDVAFECSSVNKVLDTLVAAVKPTGVIVIVSIWSHPASINVHSVVMKELDVRGTIAYVNDHQETIKLVEEGKINLEPFITQRIQLDDLISQGFETLIHNNESAVKIIVHP